MDQTSFSLSSTTTTPNAASRAGTNNGDVDTHPGLIASGEQRDFHIKQEFETALYEQVKSLAICTSNISPANIYALKAFAKVLNPMQECSAEQIIAQQYVFPLGLNALIEVLNSRFYFTYAMRRFDRYINQAAHCKNDPDHIHSYMCLEYRLKASANWMSCIDRLVTPALEDTPIVENPPMRTNADATTPRLLSLPPSPLAQPPLVDLSGAEFVPNRNVGFFNMTENDVRERVNSFFTQNQHRFLPNIVRPPSATLPCYECLLIWTKHPDILKVYHESDHALVSLRIFLQGEDWQWTKEKTTIPPPFRANAGNMKKQREIDLAIRDEKRKRNLLVAAWNNLHKREHPKQSVKDRNRAFREATMYHCNGLVDKAKKAWNVVCMADEMLDEAQSTIETVKKIKNNVKDTLSRMLPHLAGLFARWMVQPPNFWAMCIDMFVLIERVCPDKVRYTFDQLIIKALAYKDGLRAGPIDAKHGSDIKDREELTKRYSKDPKHRVNGGRKDSKDENLTKSSFLTLLAELTTGIRLKDRAQWTLDAAMAFGKTMRDVNSYRKATLEVVTTVTTFLGKYIKCAMWQKMFEHIPSKADLAKFVTEVEAIQAYTDVELNAVDFPAQMDRLWKTAIEVRALLISTKLENNVARQLEYACGALSRFRSRHFVRIQQHLAAVRTVPFVISLVGESGVHKSDTATMLAKDMCHPGNCNIDIGSADVSELIFYYSALKHCDGYRGQPVFFWDDIFQKESTVNSSSEDDEFVKFIRWISNAQIHLPMAHVDDKGRLLSSPLFVTTSNEVYPNPKSCKTEAVQRRRNILCYVTVDKTYELYPEEAIEYALPDGKIYKEQTLQYMQFHIIPSVNRTKEGAVVGTNLAPPHVKHGNEGGLSYTQFLKICVERFNAWQGTSSTPRMYAQTPARRVFGMGAPSYDPKINDRFDPEHVDVKVPKFNPNGGGFSKYSNRKIDVKFEKDCDEVEFEEDFGPIQEPFTQRDRLEHQNRKMSEFLYKFDNAKKLVYQISEYLGVPFRVVFSLMRKHLNLFLLGALVALIAGCVSVYALLTKGSDLDVLIPSDARKEFIDQCHPVIQEELDNLLIETTLELEQAKLRANMSAQGYDRAIMKGKASRVTTKPAHLQRMEQNINMQVNAGHANNVAVEMVLYKNIRSICLKDGRALMQAIGLCGQWMVVTAHFFQYAKVLNHIKDGKCWIRLGENGVDRWSGEIDMQMVRFLGDDIAVFKLPKFCTSFRDIRKHFVHQSEFAEARNLPVRMLSTTGFTRVVQATATLRCQEQSYDDETLPDVIVKVAQWFQVSTTNLTKGDCGGPMIVDHHNRVAGIHSASNGITGIVAPVWREMFDFCVEDYAREEIPETITPVHANGRGSVEPIGLVPPQWSNYILDKTDLIPSPIHGRVGPVQKEPSVKSLKDVRVSEEARKGEEPIWKSFGKYFEPVHDIPSEFMRKAYIAVTAVLSLVRPTTALQRRVLDEEEVLNGTRDGTFPSLNIHTSAGMPQRTYAPGKPGKTAFFERMSDDRLRWGKTVAAQKFKKDYEHYEMCLKAGVVPFVMLTEQLKDETLKKSKINDAKTRTFEVFPGPLALIFRKYFGAFNAAVQKECTEKPISVGINPHSLAWAILYHRLNRFGGKVIAGDYVAWDKRLNAQAIYKAVELINEWYDKDDSISPEVKSLNARVRLLLAVILIHSNVVVQNIMYQTEQGLPSGVPITSVLNSVANWLYLYSAIFQVLESKGKGNLVLPHELNEHVELALYGDDHIIALSALLREFVTFRDIRDVFTERRVGYTDANKNDNSDFDFENLTDVTFLKRKFNVQGDRVYAPLDIVSVEDQLNWINKNKTMNDFEVLAQCFNGFQIEAHLHGKAYFDQKMEALRIALEECTSDLKADALVRLSNSEYKDHWSQYNDQYSQL